MDNKLSNLEGFAKNPKHPFFALQLIELSSSKKRKLWLFTWPSIFRHFPGMETKVRASCSHITQATNGNHRQQKNLPCLDVIPQRGV